MRVLMKNNATFEQIKKSLEEYIERKRISYPRFYFLSNDELLEILSKARTPKTLEPYLYKMFEHVEGFAMDKDQPCGVSNFLGEHLLFKQFSLRPQA
jgi:dynein heavy chain